MENPSEPSPTPAAPTTPSSEQRLSREGLARAVRAARLYLETEAYLKAKRLAPEAEQHLAREAAQRLAEPPRDGEASDDSVAPERSEDSAAALEVFDRLCYRSGPLGDLVTVGARRIAQGENPEVVADELYPAIFALILDSGLLRMESQPEPPTESATANGMQRSQPPLPPTSTPSSATPSPENSTPGERVLREMRRLVELGIVRPVGRTLPKE
jgi:hypothetical protein